MQFRKLRKIAATTLVALLGIQQLPNFATKALAEEFDYSQEYYSITGEYIDSYSAIEIYPENAADLPLQGELSVLVDANTGFVLHGRGMHERAYPASMTKVMTALLLLESGLAMDDRILHTEYAIFSIMPGSSNIAMNPGDTITVEEALYAIMLPSANDVSNAIAEHLGGSLETFAQMMTARAHELGAVNTNFTNAHGLPHPDHYTTAYDMYLIMREAIQHPKLLEVINSTRVYIPPTETQPEFRPAQNTNRMVFPENPEFNPDIVGGKTGWTTPSRHTLVSYAERNGVHLISVVMRAENRGVIFSDTTTLMDYGFASFAPRPIFNVAEFSDTVELLQRSGSEAVIIGELAVYAEENVVLNLPQNFDVSQIEMNISLADRVSVPVSRNFALGRIDFVYNDQILASTLLRASEDAPELPAEQLVQFLPSFSPPAPSFSPVSAVSEYFSPDLGLLSLIFNISLATLGLILLIFVCFKLMRFSSKKRSRYTLRTPRRQYDFSKDYRYRN